MNTEMARGWVERWERQQERYAHRRSERFEVICDVLEAIDPYPSVIVDLGCGPGSLAARVAARFPECRVIAVDIDPFLIALGRAVHRGIEFVRTDIGRENWVHSIPVAPVCAVVSSTALHYPSPAILADIYRTCADVIRPGGVMVNADQLYPSPLLHSVGRLVAARSARWRGTHVPSDEPDPSEDWEQWWAAAHRVPAFAELLAQRAREVPPHEKDNDVMTDEHRRLMLDNGFIAADTVWQCGFSTVLVGRCAE